MLPKKAQTKITLFNRFERSDGSCALLKTLFDRCSWQENYGISTSNRQQDSAEYAEGSTEIIIPFSVLPKKYLSPKDFARLPFEEKENYFTLASGDKIVKGHIEEDYSRPVELEKALGSDVVRTIVNVAVNDFGSRSMQHYGVEAN